MTALVLDIWRSFRAIPLWVQVWIVVILVPVNLATVAFWAEPGGVLIALLALGGMAPNLYFMAVERGVSKVMSIPHLVVWIPLLVIITPKMGTGSSYATFLLILFIVDAISIGFDIKDTWAWLKGDRGIAD